jgi:hypothetical protein
MLQMLPVHQALQMNHIAAVYPIPFRTLRIDSQHDSTLPSGCASGNSVRL